MQRQQSEAAVVDFDVQLIDWPVAVNHPRDSIRIATDQAVHGSTDAVFSQTAHFEEPSFQLFKIRLKVPSRCFWHNH